MTSPVDISPSTDQMHQSLEGMHGSVKVPDSNAGFWKQWRAFAGPAILVSVGYMDPGNWGTDLAGSAVQIWTAVGRRTGQCDGDFLTGDFRAAGRGHG